MIPLTTESGLLYIGEVAHRIIFNGLAYTVETDKAFSEAMT